LDPVPLVPKIDNVAWLERTAPIFHEHELCVEGDAGGGCSRRQALESPARTVGVGHAPLTVDELDNVTNVHFFGAYLWFIPTHCHTAPLTVDELDNVLDNVTHVHLFGAYLCFLTCALP
jgi:hypothetical protein